MIVLRLLLFLAQKIFGLNGRFFLAVIFALEPSVYVHAPVQMGDLRG